MKESLRVFRKEHECKDCMYYRKECKARDRCVFDYLPPESLDEDIELFLIL